MLMHQLVEQHCPALFELHAGLDMEPAQREKLERLCRYVSRPPVAEDRLALMPTGHLRYALETPHSANA